MSNNQTPNSDDPVLLPFRDQPGAAIIRERLSEHLHPIAVDKMMNLGGNWVSALYPAHCFGLLDPKRNARIDRMAGGFRIIYGKLRTLRKIHPEMPAKEFSASRPS